MSNPFIKRYYHKRKSLDFAVSNHPVQEFISGAMSLSDQVRCFRAGGLPPAVRQLTDSVYDEDDSAVVDPSVNYGSDRFERAEAIASQISERMRKKHKKRFEEADV